MYIISFISCESFEMLIFFLKNLLLVQYFYLLLKFTLCWRNANTAAFLLVSLNRSLDFKSDGAIYVQYFICALL